MESPRPVRTAKTIAKIKLLSKTPHEKSTDAQPVPVQNRMAGVSTQTDPLVPVEPAVGVDEPVVELVVPTPNKDDNTMEGIRSLIKDLSDKVDKATAARSRSRSASSRRSKRRRSKSSGYSPTSSRGSGSRRRSGSSRRRSNSSRSRRRSPRRRSRTRSRGSRSPSSRRRRRSSSRSTRASPRASRRDTDTRDTATKALDKQYPKMGTSSGKRISTRHLTLQPYKHLPPDLKHTAGERRSRRDLTLPEHVCGLLNFALEAIPTGTDLHSLISHAAQVSQDAATLPWPAVRGWSQAALSHVQEGRAEWADSEFLRSERTRLSWIKGRQMESLCRTPCPDFNTTKCTEKDTHASEGRTWLHVCAACLYITGEERPTHGAKACWSKGGSRQNDDRKHDNRGRGGHYKGKRDKPENRPKN